MSMPFLDFFILQFHLTVLKSPKKAKKRSEGANSNVFSMFEQTQIQEFKEVSKTVRYTVMIILLAMVPRSQLE